MIPVAPTGLTLFSDELRPNGPSSLHYVALGSSLQPVQAQGTHLIVGSQVQLQQAAITTTSKQAEDTRRGEIQGKNSGEFDP